MIVKIRVSMAGDRFSWVPGDVVDVPDDEAERLIAAGYAVETKVIETAALAAPMGRPTPVETRAPKAAKAPKAAAKAPEKPPTQ